VGRWRTLLDLPYELVDLHDRPSRIPADTG
jgi:hypothetical protein